MKKNLLFPVILLFLSCGNEKPLNPLKCTEFSINCELMKEWVLINPIKFSDQLRDVFNDSIRCEEWYLLNTTNTNILLPVGKLNEDYFTDNGMGGNGHKANFIQDYIKSGIIRLDTVGVWIRQMDQKFGSFESNMSKFTLALSGSYQVVISHWGNKEPCMRYLLQFKK